MAFVYWVKHKDHTDAACEGYVGITSLTVKRRFMLHKSPSKSRSKTILVRALEKYKDDIQVVTLLEGDMEYCQLIENKLRPTKYIGWNICVGGASTRLGDKNTVEHNLKISKAIKGKVRTKEQAEVCRRVAKAALTFEFPWEHPYANLLAWSLSLEAYKLLSDRPDIGKRSLSKILGISSDCSLKVLNKIRSGWNPNEDSSYLSWLEEYEKGKSYV